MSDIQTQLPIKISDGTNVVGISSTGPALKVDPSSFTSPVSGTITSVPSGTQAVSGTVTNVPSGTQTVAGTVTAVPTGTQAVSGTVTNVPSGTQTVAGTVTANAGTGTFTTQDVADGPVAPGTAANKSMLAGMVYNATPPTPTDGQQLAFQSDSNGNLKVAGSLTTTPSGTQPVSGTITAVQSGTYAVSGTVTNVPSGTQTVAGTITAVPTGTQAVSGTVTNVPSGTQTVAGTVTNVPSGTQTVTGSITYVPETSGIVTFYDTVATVAAASTGTISYTVTSGKTLYWKGIIATSSGGPCKVIVDHGAGPTVVHVGFYSAASPFLNVTFPQPVLVAATEVVNVKIQNNNDTAQDIYATIFGAEH